MDQTDEALVDLFRQTGEASYFKTLVGRYQTRIFSSAYRMLGNVQEAEEIVQDTFIKVHQNLSRYRRHAAFAAWLFTIVHNLSIDAMRNKKRKDSYNQLSFVPGQNPNDDETMVVAQIADSDPEPDKQVDLLEQGRLVAESLMELPDTQRAVLVLHDLEGFSYEEIAAITGCSLGTVRSRLHYGRLKMREQLAPYFYERNTTASAR